MPPAPTATTGPNTSSLTTPAINSKPPWIISVTSTPEIRAAGAFWRALSRTSAIDASSSARVRIPTLTPPTSVLCAISGDTILTTSGAVRQNAPQEEFAAMPEALRGINLVRRAAWLTGSPHDRSQNPCRHSPAIPAADLPVAVQRQPCWLAHWRLRDRSGAGVPQRHHCPQPDPILGPSRWELVRWQQPDGTLRDIPHGDNGQPIIFEFNSGIDAAQAPSAGRAAATASPAATARPIPASVSTAWPARAWLARRRAWNWSRRCSRLCRRRS